MNVTIAKISAEIDEGTFTQAVAAIQNQVTAHFEPEWGISAKLTAATLNIKDAQAPVQGHHNAIIYLGKSSQDPTTGVSGALGYHTKNFSNVPYGFVYLDIASQYGEDWTVTLSHEVLELLADPTAVKSVNGPAPYDSQRRVSYDLEVCDACQGDSYPIDTVNVSNFVGKAYFGLLGGSGNTNYMKEPLESFGVRPGGYFQYSDGIHVYQIKGQKVTAVMLSAKATLGLARRAVRRQQRLPINAASEISVPQEAQSRALQAAISAAITAMQNPEITSVSDKTFPPNIATAADTNRPAVKMDTVEDVAKIAVGVAQIVSVTGF